MNDLTFANTRVTTREGRTLNVGDVLRPKDAYPFCDHVILGFSGVDKYDDVYVKLSRPYAYASCVGTTGPGVLLGAETYVVSISRLVDDMTVGHDMVSGLREPTPDEIIDMRETEVAA